MPLNMLSGFDFSELQFGNGYSGTSSSFTVYNYDGTSETFTGYGFWYDPYYGPTGDGVVTGYQANGYYGELLISIAGISLPANWIVDASKTYSTTDDFAVVQVGLGGDDTILGSDYADVLDGFNGNDSISAYGGDDTVY